MCEKLTKQPETDLQPVQMASAHVSSRPALLPLLTLSLFYSPSHLLKVIGHLLGNRQTLLHCIKKVQKQISATTDQTAFISKVMESSAGLWNPSSLQTLNHSSSPMTLFQIINLVSDHITQLEICCFCSPNNGWRSSMPDMKSEPYP